MTVRIADLTPQYARTAAELHAQGQPGTFLTSLGAAFLQALYGEMALSVHCYGFVALGTGDGAEAPTLGVVVGTDDACQVFRDLIWRRGLHLALPVLGAIIRRPSLVARIWETLFYPAQVESQPGKAELFYIGVRPEARRVGVGAALFRALADASQQRGMETLGLTVEATNTGALAFYVRQGMARQHDITLYGRRMYWLNMPLQDHREREAS
jgi:ribosomal protein S18 acetylase RimI-like enzyme